jgi:putative pyruvate formate lyase activating enzyme
VDRTAGKTGFCGLPDAAIVDCAVPHLGEEPPLSGRFGSGTIFFTSCNLRCIFCQNFQISHTLQGQVVSAAELAGTMVDLQDEGCHNINAVTPTPHVPFLLEALRLARSRGLTIPLVYNCSGYESLDVIRLLAGEVDLYLPDFKFGHDETARMCCGVEDYTHHALNTLEAMALQVGEDLEMDPEGEIATRGLLVRHLVLPGMVDNSLAALGLIRARLSEKVTLSLMSQYTPIPTVRCHPLLGRRVTRREYETVVEHALSLGFDNLFIQEVSDRHLTPDFGKDVPFDW